MKYDKYLLAQLNKRMVIDFIRTQGPINKAEIARILGLSIPTVMKITDEFSEKRIINTIGKGASSGGKRPELLEFVSDSYYIVGIDIGRHSVKVILMDMSADIIVKKVMKTVISAKELDQYKDFFDSIIDLVNEVINHRSDIKGKILGIGIGMPGLLDKENGTVLFSPDFTMENIPILKYFQDRLNYKIILENSNRAMGMGEQWFGSGVNSNVGLFVNLGYGIGSCLIEEGELYLGSSGTSGELGHFTLEKNGNLCDCGNRGCLEALASGNAIAREAIKQIEKGTITSILDYANGTINDLEAAAVFEAAKHQDELANKIIDQAMEYIGIGLAGCINLLDPDVVVLSGGLMKSQNVVFPKVMESIKKHQMKAAGRKVRICPGKLGEDATAIGAATLILKSFIDHGGEF